VALAENRGQVREVERSAQECESLLYLLGIVLVAAKAVLQSDRVQIKMGGDPRETEGLLRGQRTEEPLTCTAYDVTLTMSGSESITDSAGEYSSKKITLRFDRRMGVEFVISLGRELVYRQ
jgi:hypothetical protein